MRHRRRKDLAIQKTVAETQWDAAIAQGEAVRQQEASYEEQRRAMKPDLDELRQRLDKNGVSRAVWNILRGTS